MHSKIFTFSDPGRAAVGESDREASAQVLGPVHSQEVRGVRVRRDGDLLDFAAHGLQTTQRKDISNQLTGEP